MSSAPFTVEYRLKLLEDELVSTEKELQCTLNIMACMQYYFEYVQQQDIQLGLQDDALNTLIRNMQSHQKSRDTVKGN